MHDTAYRHGRLFFELYGPDTFRTVVELGSQDINGSLRDHCSAETYYIGLDVMPANGVDVVISPSNALPLASDSVDAVVTSSAFEHDVGFWETFLELVRILRPGGLLYLNAPSNGAFHRHPLDCWRFYPDAGVALVRWAARRGMDITLIESFIAQPEAEHWADFVAVFRKAGGGTLRRLGCIADKVPAINIHDIDTPAGAALRAEVDIMPDRQQALQLQTELVEAARQQADLATKLVEQKDGFAADLALAKQRQAAMSDELAAVSNERTALSTRLAATLDEVAALRLRLQQTQRLVAERETDLAEVSGELAAIRNSTSWRLTAGPRLVARVIRGR